MRETVVFTHSGRLGDMVYALPVVKAYAEAHDVRPVLVLSPLGRFLLPLLERQSYLGPVLISERYRDEKGEFGVQPFRVTLEGLDPGLAAGRVFHLGLRPDTPLEKMLNQHLTRTAADNLVREGGPDIEPDLARSFLEASPEIDQGVPTRHGSGIRMLYLEKPYVVFQPFGVSTLQYYLAPGGPGGRPDLDFLLNALTTRDFPSLAGIFTRKDLWKELLGGLGARVIMVGGRDDLNLCRQFFREIEGLRPAQPADGLALARLIGGAAVFIGCQSVGAALAEGLKAPRLVDRVYGNALPFPGPEAPYFSLSGLARPWAVSSPAQADRKSLAQGRDFIAAALRGDPGFRRGPGGA
ncbi:MAG: hypothetical protein V1816_16530 [Pseudomonadota bacterium]